MMSENAGSSIECNGIDKNPRLSESNEIEFDVGPALISDRESEEGSDSDHNNWEEHVLHTKQRVLSEDVSRNDVDDVNPGTKLVGELPMAPTFPATAAKFPRAPSKYSDTYELEKFRKNAMIILNHETFLGSMKPRKGTMQDQKLLEETFGKFNFIIEPHLNLQKNVVMMELKAFAAKDFTEYGCVCVAVMTHGSHSGRLRAFDRYYYEQEVIECFDVNQNRTLLGKPIIFLIQACRGDNPATAINTDTPKQDQEFEYDNELHYDLPIQSNMIIFHSSWFGQASVRPLDGSWFIQILCKHINLLADTEDFQTICRIVQKEIALDKKFTTSDNVVAKQMPVFNTILIRRLFLRKYEGRDDVDHPDSVEKTNTEVNVSAARGADDKMQRMLRRIRKCRDTYYVDHPNSAIGEKTITKAALSMVPVNNSAPRVSDDQLPCMIRCLSVYTHDNPNDAVAMYILEKAKTIVTNGSTDVKVFVQNLIMEYIKQNAVNKYMIFEQSCRCNKDNTNWFGKIFSQVGPAVCSLATVTMVCVAVIKIGKL